MHGESLGRSTLEQNEVDTAFAEKAIGKNREVAFKNETGLDLEKVAPVDLVNKAGEMYEQVASRINATLDGEWHPNAKPMILIRFGKRSWNELEDENILFVRELERKFSRMNNFIEGADLTSLVDLMGMDPVPSFDNLLKRAHEQVKVTKNEDALDNIDRAISNDAIKVLTSNFTIKRSKKD
ncbi:hypothetical protein KAZ57_01240 [Patescibacteria group bacterium]|nr:hypothetical protein [Patescibacteria group bacterium]